MHTATTLTLNEVASTETYHGIENIIWEQIKRFKRQFGYYLATEEDLLSLANEAFMKAYTDYDSKKGRFITRVSYLVWFCFLNEYIHNPARRRNRIHGELIIMNTDEIDAKNESPSLTRFNTSQFLEELNEDACMITRLVLDTPEDLRNTLVLNCPSPNGRFVRAGLRQYLLGLGWTARRISMAFSEITTAIS